MFFFFHLQPSEDYGLKWQLHFKSDRVQATRSNIVVHLDPPWSGVAD